MTSTKRSAKRCKVPAGRKPTRSQWQREKWLAVELWQTLDSDVIRSGPFRKSRSTKDSLPPAHVWPVYGGKCWQQAYAEMIAFQLVANTWMALESAKRSPYMPESVLATYIAAYNAAKTEYLAAWGAMEDCLDTIV